MKPGFGRCKQAGHQASPTEVSHVGSVEIEQINDLSVDSRSRSVQQRGSVGVPAAS